VQAEKKRGYVREQGIIRVVARHPGRTSPA
jgi:hypothetical protein